MAHLIDKSALVAEIERLKAELGNTFSDKWACGSLDNILSFLDTLEVKEVDLTEAINSYIESSLTGTNSIYTKGTVSCIIEKTAKQFFELGLKAQKGE